MSAPLIAALQVHLRAQLIETHISWVLLDGQHAWKIKKPVKLPFLDCSELAHRHALCEQELLLNRRLAPQLYLDVVPITGTPQAPQLNGVGEPIEYALRMKQFGAGQLFSERLAAGTLTTEHIDKLAVRLAAFHGQAAVAGVDTPGTELHATPQAIHAASMSVVDGLIAQGRGPTCTELKRWLQDQAERLQNMWLQRKATGHVVEGHGDLHLANVVVLGDEVTAFDCIEFDPALRWADPMSDIAFLVMDLLAHRRGDLAFRFLNAYLDASGDHEGLPTLRYALVYRALVRAYVGGMAGAQADAAGRPDYLALAWNLSQTTPLSLTITHGLSGSGKTVASQAVLEQTQAIRVRSDVERKRLFGLDALDHTSEQDKAEVYGAAASQRLYARLCELAELVIKSGFAVIVDATCLLRAERDLFRQLAHRLHVPFQILHCQASDQALRERIQARSARGDDASEANLAVLDWQLAHQEPLHADEQAEVSHWTPPDTVKAGCASK